MIPGVFRSSCRPVLAALLALSAGSLGVAQTASPPNPMSPNPMPTIQMLPNSAAVTYLGSMPGWFVCDGLDSPNVAVMGWPGSNGRSRLTTYSKANPGTYFFQSYRVGPADPGAGQIHYSLTPSAPSAAGNGVPNNIGAFNLQSMPDALTPSIVTLGSAEMSAQCRWTVNTRLLGFNTRRSVQITETPDGQLSYQTWNYADPVRMVNPDGVQRTSRPSLSIAGGSKSVQGGQEVFVFQNAAYTYTVRVAQQGQPAGASVSVSRGSRVIQTEAMTGYTYAVRKP